MSDPALLQPVQKTDKLCPKCKETKPVSEFYSDSARYDGLKGWCKLCHNSCTKNWQQNNKERTAVTRQTRRRNNPGKEKSYYHPNKYLKRTYGITEEEKTNILFEQGNKCAVCGSMNPQGPYWHTDHDHISGTIRGILCSKCNMGIGLFNDSSELLFLAFKYMKERE
jgi:Recombination endonuclease VII